jgi:Mg-chelatase subunit ChlD
MIRKLFSLSAAIVAATLLALPSRAQEKKDEKQPARPKVEVVFCLDTTGSMSGLLEGAKQKIWSISNQIASGKPGPDLKIGLIGYRDKGDAYVTEVTDMTADLDAIYAKLKTFQAAGGGDTPEHVNQALHDAVHKVAWSKDNKTLRIIFLVGDAPPHMDYTDDVKHPETCKKACEKGIIINTIQCGTMNDTIAPFKEIALKAEGSYVQIQQDGGVTPVVATPFDKRLGEINTELAKTTLVYGRGNARRDAEAKKEDVKNLAAAAPGVAAERIAAQAKLARSADFDLNQQLKEGKVKLEELQKDKDALPDELKGKSLEEQKKIVKELAEKQAELNKEAIELDKKRTDYIAKETAKLKKESGFDGQVLQMLRKQAQKFKIEY